MNNTASASVGAARTKPDTTVRTGVEAALEALRRGEPVILLDDDDRETEGNLVLAAEHATSQTIAFLVRHTSGYLCVAAMDERWEHLQVPRMPGFGDRLGTGHGVAVDAREGVDTGISARDRARTIRVLADPDTRPQDLIRPGHVVTLRARQGGLFQRRGHAEATVDLMLLAGLRPVGVLCAVVRDDGPTADHADLTAMASAHDLIMVTIDEIVTHRSRHSSTVTRVATTSIPTDHCEFILHGYRDAVDGSEHLALVRGLPETEATPLVRVHCECLAGDAFGSRRCDCGQQLDLACAKVAAAGSGVVVYLRAHEGSGIGLVDKLRACALQDDRGHDAVTAAVPLGLLVDARDYRAAAHILRDLGIDRVDLLTNNQAKVEGLVHHGVGVHRRLPLVTNFSTANTYRKGVTR